MKIEQFFYVLEIANTGSFSQAARNLHISQPNLSYAVKQIEQEVGFPLFIRTSSGVVPTVDGSRLIDQFRIIKHDYEQVERIIHSPTHKPPRLSLRIGTMNLDQFTYLFSDTIQRYINTPVDFSFVNYANLKQLLPLIETCCLDFAIIGILTPYSEKTISDLSNRSIEYHHIAKAPLCALVGPSNPLYYGPPTISLNMLHSYTIVSRGNSSDDPEYSLPRTTRLSSSCFGEIHVNSTHFFYDIIRSTTAVGLAAYVPNTFHQQLICNSIRPLLLSDSDIKAEFGWIKHDRLSLSRQAIELLDKVEEFFL